MDKETIIKRICTDRLVAVIRGSTLEEARQLAKACISGGIQIIEITFTVPGADKLIEALSQEFREADIIIGAGTVLEAATARIALLQGAQFIVSPCLNVEVIQLCNRYRVLAMPGIMTVREAVLAMEAGAEILKVFPGELLGPKFVKALKGPLPQVRLMPTGGVNLDNIHEWLQAGSIAVGIGGNLTRGVAAGDYAQIVERAKCFVHAAQKAKNGIAAT